ncbi:MAG: trehalose-phosphatase [Candidatus Omnitrophica bacterium]|nr:trehalose-phosphatase [Candidatus Omnitrophota bacterium]
MKHLSSDWGKIWKTLKGKFLYLFLDYDGTLAPIAQTPDKAIMTNKAKDLLRQVSKMPNVKIAIVSGRKLSDIEKRIRLKNIVYVGNHGFEIKGPKIKFESHLPLRYERSLDEIKAKLKKQLAAIKGAVVEDKGFSLGVHYRLVDKKNVQAVKNIFYATALIYELKNIITVKTGKMALEIRPAAAWDKGKVVLWLLGRRLFVMRNKKMKVIPVYIGDDTTDEDAFEVLKDKGITIFVGKPKNTKARFYLKDTEEVAEFLEAILKI